MSPEDMRLAARDLLMMNRVLASWSPRPKQTSVSSEPLNSAPCRDPLDPLARAQRAGPHRPATHPLALHFLATRIAHSRQRLRSVSPRGFLWWLAIRTPSLFRVGR